MSFLDYAPIDYDKSNEMLSALKTDRLMLWCGKGPNALDLTHQFEAIRLKSFRKLWIFKRTLSLSLSEWLSNLLLSWITENNWWELDQASFIPLLNPKFETALQLRKLLSVLVICYRQRWRKWAISFILSTNYIDKFTSQQMK